MHHTEILLQHTHTHTLTEGHPSAAVLGYYCSPGSGQSRPGICEGSAGSAGSTDSPLQHHAVLIEAVWAPQALCMGDC